MKVLFSLLLFGAVTLEAQVNKQALVFAGSDFSGIWVHPGKYGQGIYPNYWFARIGPHIDIRLGKRFYLGAMYELNSGRFEHEKLPVLQGWGGLARYYFNTGFKGPVLRDRLRVYAEASLLWMNYSFDNSSYYGIQPIHSFSNQKIQALFGLNWRIYGNLYLDFATTAAYVTSDKLFSPGSRLGLQYHFAEERVPFAKISKPKKKESWADLGKGRLRPLDFRYFLKEIGFSVDYSFIFDDNNTSDLFYYKENMATLGASVSLSSDIDFAIKITPVWTQTRTLGQAQYFMYGATLSYDIWRNPSKGRIFVESGFYKGNYCTCGDDLTYKAPNLSYLPISFGVEERFYWDRLFFKFQVNWYRILNDPDETGSYAHPNFGLVYRLY